jgi:hypothetical protein
MPDVSWLVLPMDATVAVPPAVAMCPICGAALVITLEACELDDDETWKASEIHVECTTEPDLDDAAWQSWHNGHYAMPYVDWLPLNLALLAWLRHTYRFTETAHAS